MTSTCPLAVSGFSTAPGVGPAGAAGPAGAGGGGAAGAGAAGAATPPARAFSTSALTIRPPGPDPTSPAKSSPRSLATRLAIGEALTRPSPGGVATGAGEGVTAGVAAG